ncbi:MAG: hypothetical protein SX243_07065 [Acidobacteriota bacterium]|nr:hypothetical protein [Acidobacteriota bacterium]
MKIVARTLIPAFVLALALCISGTASAQQPGDWTVDTVIGELRIPTASAVGAGRTCEEAADNARDQLAEDYLLLSVSYGRCLCSDVIDPWTGKVVTTLCSVEATARVFRRFILLN